MTRKAMDALLLCRLEPMPEAAFSGQLHTDSLIQVLGWTPTPKGRVCICQTHHRETFICYDRWLAAYFQPVVAAVPAPRGKNPLKPS